ncbi:autophagy-related protein Atg22B2 [Aspergillus flavus]|nr:autophagy-related protein Atg22B2 [Aspergillus flavus]
MSHDDRSGNQDVSSMDLSVTINEPAQESPDSTNKANVIVQGLVPQQERLPSRDELDHLFRAEEDYDQPTTTRKELWSYYLYYNGDNGVGPGSYSQALFQWALTGAGWQPGTEPHEPCTASSACVVPWAGGTLSVSSVVLIANGLCFTFMTVIFVWLGSAADYGSFGRWLLLVLTVVCWALQYGMMAIKHPNQWPAAMGINVSTAHSNIGYLLTLALNLSVLLPLQGNNYSNNLALCLTNSYWVVLGLWWFIFQQKRPGPPVPKGSSYATIGFKQLWVALREVRSLPQTFLYFLAYFLLADGLNTTGTLVSIIQNNEVSFSFLQLTYLGIVQAVTSTISTFGFWYIQKYFKISTKRMFLVTNFFSVFIPFWGMLGLWTTRIGYHHRWEFYFYNVVFGLFQAPYYAYAQTMISELMPQGYDNMFFALFGITNRASSIIGPNVIQAIINDTQNNWMGFPFLFSICTAAMIMISFVDVEKGREDGRKFVQKKKMLRGLG